MKHIINGGISTANIPSYSRDAVLLALQTNYLSGVSLNIYSTKDHQLVAYSTDSVDHGKEQIKDLTLYNLQRRNFGDRVQKHSILKLSDALSIFENYSKTLILNLENDSDEDFMKELVRLTNLYPNVDIYIKSPHVQMLNYLNSSCHRERVGAVIQEDTLGLWSEDFDFFSLCIPKINYDEVQEKVQKHKIIMVENVNTVDRYKEIANHTTNCCKDSIYVIMDSLQDLTSIDLASL